MNIRVLFFASLREAVGVEAVTLTLANGSFAQLQVALAEGLGDVVDALWAENVRVACNQELLDAEALVAVRLADGDELAFLPPVTGG